MRIRKILPALPLVLFAAPVALKAQEHAADGGGGGLFSINAGLMIWTIIIFSTVLFLLWKFAFGPILALVDAREEGIQNALDEAKARQVEAEKLLAEHKAQLAEARRQAQEILAEGRDAGDRLRRELEEKAREEGDAILARARAEIEREKTAAVDTIRRESVDLALAAASKLLHQKVDGDQDRKLVMGYVDGLSNDSSGAEA